MEFITKLKQRFCNHKFINYKEHHAFDMYGDGKFCIYRIYRCKCGKTKRVDICKSKTWV